MALLLGCGSAQEARDPGEHGPGACACVDIDCDQDGLDDPFEDALAARFAPRFEQDVDDLFLSSSVPWFLERVRMRMHHNGNCRDTLQIDVGSLRVDALMRQTAHTHGDPWPFCGEQSAVQHSWRDYGFGDDHFFLELHREGDRRGDASGAFRTCYVHASPSAAVAGGYDLQYWLFWPYNDAPLREHEGDWEHVTVRVEPAGETVHSVYFAAHSEEGNEGGVRSADELERASPTTVQVYVARGSHAMYPSAGRTDRPFPEPNDAHRGGGDVIDCRQEAIVNVGDRSCPRPEQEWILFGGRWGELGRLDVTSGPPPGPARQGWWEAAIQK